MLPDPRIRLATSSAPVGAFWSKRIHDAHAKAQFSPSSASVDLLAAADSPEEAVNLMVLRGFGQAGSIKWHTAYLLWLVRHGLADRDASFDALSVPLSTPSLSELDFLDLYSALWDRTIANAVSSLRAEGAVLTPLVALIFAIRHDLQETFARNVTTRAFSPLPVSCPLPLPLGADMDGIERDLIGWISAQTSASALQQLKSSQPAGSSWVNGLVMAHSSLIASREGVASLLPFLADGGSIAALENPHLTEAANAPLLEYAYQSLCDPQRSGTMAWESITLLNGLRRRGVVLGPAKLAGLRISYEADTPFRDFGVMSKLSRVREVCADSDLRQKIWSAPEYRLSVIRNTAGPLWGSLVVQMLDAKWCHEGLAQALLETEDWQLEGVGRAWLARIMECSSPEVRAAALSLGPRIHASPASVRVAAVVRPR
jgi:hypothetical protein